VRLFLIFGVLGGTALALGGGLFLARRSMRPIAQLTQTARALSTETLDQRINLGGPDDELRELAAMGERLQAHFGQPQDVEWAIDDGTLYLLQSRPVTTL
jgi:phosphoenolpyruvate synthase/pyruvate phosphate dikinase